jgi:fatty acid desaturase
LDLGRLLRDQQLKKNAVEPQQKIAQLFWERKSMSSLFVQAYKKFIAFATWATVILGVLTGFAIGRWFEHPVIGVAIGGVTGFFCGVFVFGLILVLIDMHQLLESIDRRLFEVTAERESGA